MDDEKYNEMMRRIEELAISTQEQAGQLAGMCQREFLAVRGEMRDGFNESRAEFRSEIGLLRNDMEVGIQGLAGMIKSVHEDVKELKDVSFSHEFRLDRLEKKTGLKK